MNSNPYLDAIIGGWQTAATLIVHSGQPYTVVTSSNNAEADNSGSNASQYPNVIGNPKLSSPTIQNWYNVAAFAQPAAGTFGDERRNSLRGPDLSEVDFSLGKNFPIKEGIALQLRIDGYNVFNHPSFSNPNTGVTFDSSGAPTSSSAITSTTIGPRAWQLNARVSF
jgi:hypothetical protein